MFRFPFRYLLGLLLLPMLSGVSHAQSLWEQRNDRFAHFFVDTRAHAVGDLLTVVIDEVTDLSDRDQRALDKASNSDVNFNFAGASSSGTSASANLNMAGDSSRTFGGNSQYRVAQEFFDQIAVTVVDVKPNGNLCIRGVRTRTLADERKKLIVTGIVRPIDIMPDNTVRSQFVARLNIQYASCGPESNFTNQGWLSRTVNRVWPF